MNLECSALEFMGPPHLNSMAKTKPTIGHDPEAGLSTYLPHILSPWTTSWSSRTSFSVFQADIFPRSFLIKIL